MSWKKVKVKDICYIKGGKRLPKNHLLTEIKTPHPYIRARDIGHGIIDFSKPVYIPEETHNLISRYTVKENDIVLTIVGANIGDVGLIPNYLNGANLTENAVKLTTHDDICHFKYLLYYFLLPGKKKELEQVAAGAAQGKLGLYKIKEIEVPLPSISTQKRIAHILSAYDDLIENNLRRIQLLEDAARCRFKSLIENGSGVKTISILNLLEHHIGGGWGSDNYQGDFQKHAYVIRGTDIPNIRVGNTSNIPFRYHKESNLRSRKLQHGDIVFEVSGGSKTSPVGRSLLINNELLSSFNTDVMCASFCKLLRPNGLVSSEFIYFFLLDSYENGALKPYEKPSASNIINFAFETYLEEETILLPSDQELQSFSHEASLQLKLITNLGMQNIRLRQARDLLLPRLINGDIDVSDVAMSDNAKLEPLEAV